MPEMHLKQPGFTYSPCGPFTKIRERIQKFKETGDSRFNTQWRKTVKVKIYKYMTSTSKNVYIDKLNDIVNEYNNTYHRTSKMKPVAVKDNAYIDFSNDKDTEFKVGDHIKISKYKNIFPKGYTPNWSEEVFVIQEVKNTVPWTYVINDLMVKKLLEYFMKKNCKKQIKKCSE